MDKVSVVVERMKELVEEDDDMDGDCVTTMVTLWEDGDFQVEVRHGFGEEGNQRQWVYFYKHFDGRITKELRRDPRGEIYTALQSEVVTETVKCE